MEQQYPAKIADLYELRCGFSQVLVALQLIGKSPDHESLNDGIVYVWTKNSALGSHSLFFQDKVSEILLQCRVKIQGLQRNVPLALKSAPLSEVFFIRWFVSFFSIVLHLTR